MNKKVFVIGSINTDINISTDRMPKMGETISGRDFLISSGGKGANQAINLSLLGLDTYMIGNIGDDIYGKSSLLNFEKFNVNTDFISIDEDNHTGVAVIIKTKGDNRIILDSGTNENVDNDLINKALKISSENDFLVTQLETGIDTGFHAIKSGKENGLTTIFNPAPAEKLYDEFYKYVDFIILNETEAEILTGIYPENDEDYKKISEFFILRGVKACIITLGSKGCVFLDENNMIIKESIKLENIIDSTGAGDAFISAFVYSLANISDIEKSLEFSNLVGAYLCTVNGAQTSNLNIENIKKFKENVNGKKNNN